MQNKTEQRKKQSQMKIGEKKEAILDFLRYNWLSPKAIASRLKINISNDIYSILDELAKEGKIEFKTNKDNKGDKFRGRAPAKLYRKANCPIPIEQSFLKIFFTSSIFSSTPRILLSRSFLFRSAQRLFRPVFFSAQ